MKTSLILLLLILSACFSGKGQTKKNSSWYARQFEITDSLIGIGLPRDAEPVFDQIIARSEKEKNHVMLLKAIDYRMVNSCYFEENALLKVIGDLRTEMVKMDFPVNQIAHSILANLYWNYYSENRWKYHNRTTLSQDAGNDIETWDLNRIMQEVITQFDSSLLNPYRLRKIPVEAFDEMLAGDKNTRNLRATLYDLLAYRALDIYKNDEAGLTKPAEPFSLNNPAFFQPASGFANIPITTNDSTSLKFKAISLYQQLTQLHLNDKPNDVLVDLELNRLEYVHNNNTIHDANSLYESALFQLSNIALNKELKAEVLYRLAYFRYDDDSQNLKGQLHPILALCDSVIENFPKTEGCRHCKKLKEVIMADKLAIDAEAQIIPHKPFLVKLTYKNLNRVFFRLYQVNSTSAFFQDNFNNQRLDSILTQRTMQEWSQTLPDSGDFKSRSVEVPVKPLDKGFYVLVVSDKTKFPKDSKTIAVAINSTNLFCSKRNSDNTGCFSINNRANGIPLANVKAEFYSREYDYEHRKSKSILFKTLMTDNNGMVYYKWNDRPVRINISQDGDTLFVPFIYSNHFNSELSSQQTAIYTDRAIYRPGQTLYFKGLMLKFKKNVPEIIPGAQETVELLDPNWNKVSSLNVTSNEYGTFSGSFVIPTGLLNGNFTIRSNNGSYDIRVEEYKRPTFEVTYQPIERAYGFNDSVTVVGMAKAFAGYPIDNAKVSYRITRNAESRWYWRPANEAEAFIANEEISTNSEGKFNIHFFTSDESIIDKNLIYTYSIVADVTDANGETHSATQTIRISKSPLVVMADLPDKVFANDLPDFKVQTTTINGEKTDAQVSVEIIKLKSPGTILFDRAWGKPNTYIINENDFRKTFPNRVYRDENNPETWKEEATVFAQNFVSTEKTGSLKEIIASLHAGYYNVKINAVNSSNDSAFWNKTIQINETKPQKAQCAKDWIIPVKTSGEPGDTAQFWISALTVATPVRYEIIHDDSIVESKWLNPGSEVCEIRIPIKEQYRGGFAVQFFQIAGGQAYQYFTEVNVPYTNKMLDISFTSFRNKLLPGEKEQWLVNIKNKNGEKETAEMLATLYDASLDNFALLNWENTFYRNKFNFWYKWNMAVNRQVTNPQILSYTYNNFEDWNKNYEQLNLTYNFWGGYNPYFNNYKQNRQRLKGQRIMTAGFISSVSDKVEVVMEEEAVFSVASENAPPPPPPPPGAEQVVVVEDAVSEMEVVPGVGITPEKSLSQIATRKNFNETAFFYPHLLTDDKGEITINFTIPEALTRWKMMGFAHTKDFKTGTISNELITQKDVSIMVNAPRFLRECDTIEFAAKVNNLSDKDISGDAMLQLFDPFTNNPIEKQLLQSEKIVSFILKVGESKGIRWKLVIPAGVQAVGYKAVAKAGQHTDGEEAILPVLVNSKLVTESLPFMVREKQTQKYRFDKMVDNKSTTLRNEAYTIEFTSNPVWYAIQAMPYLMEFPYECSEQVFSRFFANSLSTKIMNSSPRIKAVFETWKLKTPDALISNLEKNQELKELLIQETPWLRDSKNESEQKRKIALLFDLNQMSDNLNSALTKLRSKQTSNGGFAWFEGMPDDRTITQHIVTGLLQLQHLNAIQPQNKNQVETMLKTAQKYLDERIVEDYTKLLEQSKKDTSIHIEKDHLTMLQIHYLYSRSFNQSDIKEERLKEAYNFYYNQAKTYWLAQTEYAQGMLALTFNRAGDKEKAAQIIKSLSNRATRSEELGMYWPNNHRGYMWYQAPVETQAMLIEAFNEVTADTASVEEMKIWMLRNKQTNHWGTTKATAAACYSLLLRGVDQLASTKLLEVKVGNKKLESLANISAEAGTGYVKTTFDKKEIKPDMGKLKVYNPNNGIAWGAAYWQYFEQLDKITSAETNLKIVKKLFLKEYTTSGAVLKEITVKNPIKVGDE
ncbi:MAG TPA: alpha-2-macroglobulin family protein, partial [Prolixibacteraceae bacterium]|nr:alpha-2-macroglobulin family protein [Prolixibacteraceae bacterium]